MDSEACQHMHVDLVANKSGVLSPLSPAPKHLRNTMRPVPVDSPAVAPEEERGATAASAADPLVTPRAADKQAASAVLHLLLEKMGDTVTDWIDAPFRPPQTATQLVSSTGVAPPPAVSRVPEVPSAQRPSGEEEADGENLFEPSAPSSGTSGGNFECLPHTSLESESLLASRQQSSSGSSSSRRRGLDFPGDKRCETRRRSSGEPDEGSKSTQAGFDTSTAATPPAALLSASSALLRELDEIRLLVDSYDKKSAEDAMLVMAQLQTRFERRTLAIMDALRTENDRAFCVKRCGDAPTTTGKAQAKGKANIGKVDSHVDPRAVTTSPPPPRSSLVSNEDSGSGTSDALLFSSRLPSGADTLSLRSSGLHLHHAAHAKPLPGGVVDMLSSSGIDYCSTEVSSDGARDPALSFQITEIAEDETMSSNEAECTPDQC